MFDIMQNVLLIFLEIICCKIFYETFEEIRYKGWINIVQFILFLSSIRDFALKNKNPCSACEFQAKQGISIWGIKLLFFSV